jgi:hypothetical protein
VKVYKGWGAFAELCEYLIPDIELAIEKLTGETIPLSYDLSDKKLLGEFPDEYLYALKRVAAHVQMKGELPPTSFAEDLSEEDEEYIGYIEGYEKGFKFGSLVFFSETVGVYLPVKGLDEPIHFEHEDKSVEMCSIGSLYALREDLRELKELLENKAEGEFDESIPWHVEKEIVNKLLEWTEEAIKEQKPLVLVGEG